MPISAAGNKSRASVQAGAERRSPTRRRTSADPGASFRRSGFTLVELMVVITIIGLASAVAVWAMPDPGGRVLDEGLRFAARVRAARDLAVVDARPVSLWVTTGGYGFDRRVAGSWVPVAEKSLRVERWSDGTRASLIDVAGRTRVTFDPTGVADRGADVRLDRGDAAALIRIEATGEVRADAQ